MDDLDIVLLDDITTKYLQSLAIQADKILREELSKSKLDYDFAEARILNIRTVGVQGDDRTYSYPAEINIRKNGVFVWDPEFNACLSNRITNEISGINRVLYVLDSGNEYMRSDK